MRLGRAISYVPMPVLVGFASGIAVIIASTQAAPMCGIHAVAAETVWERLRVIWASRHEIQPSAIGATVATIAIISLFRRLRPLWPGAVIAVVAVTLVAQSPGLGLPTIGSAFPGFGSMQARCRTCAAGPARARPPAPRRGWRASRSLRSTRWRR